MTSYYLKQSLWHVQNGNARGSSLQNQSKRRHGEVEGQLACGGLVRVPMMTLEATIGCVTKVRRIVPENVRLEIGVMQQDLRPFASDVKQTMSHYEVLPLTSTTYIHEL